MSYNVHLPDGRVAKNIGFVGEAKEPGDVVRVAHAPWRVVRRLVAEAEDAADYDLVVEPVDE